MFKNFKYLVLSGGGPNGFLHIGALQFIERCLFMTSGVSVLAHFKGFAGTSVGALMAFCLAIGLDTSTLLYTLRRLLPQILTLDLSLFSLIETKGLRETIGLSKLIDEVLMIQFKRTDITFSELNKLNNNRQLTICACNVMTNQIEFFNCDTFPDVSVKKAVLASMAIPIMYPPVRIDDQLYIDGGCQLNLPICVYPLDQTLALWIRESITPASRNKVLSEFTTFTKQVIKTFFYAQDTLIYNCFFVKFPNNFVQLPAFTNGFLPVPQHNTSRAIRMGSLRTGQHLLSVCPCASVLFLLIIEHVALYIPRLFIIWVLAHILIYAITTQLIQGGARRVARVEYLMHGEPSGFF
jgi:hypothetical protein